MPDQVCQSQTTGERYRQGIIPPKLYLTTRGEKGHTGWDTGSKDGGSREENQGQSYNRATQQSRCLEQIIPLNQRYSALPSSTFKAATHHKLSTKQKTWINYPRKQPQPSPRTTTTTIKPNQTNRNSRSDFNRKRKPTID